MDLSQIQSVRTLTNLDFVHLQAWYALGCINCAIPDKKSKKHNHGKMLEKKLYQLCVMPICFPTRMLNASEAILQDGLMLLIDMWTNLWKIA